MTSACPQRESTAVELAGRGGDDYGGGSRPTRRSARTDQRRAGPRRGRTRPGCPPRAGRRRPAPSWEHRPASALACSSAGTGSCAGSRPGASEMDSTRIEAATARSPKRSERGEVSTPFSSGTRARASIRCAPAAPERGRLGGDKSVPPPARSRRLATSRAGGESPEAHVRTRRPSRASRRPRSRRARSPDRHVPTSASAPPTSPPTPPGPRIRVGARAHQLAGARSTSTPGLSMPAGSTAALAARSAAANGSGRWRSYHGRWSRPTAW